ncbi:MAG: Lpg1974 family pore-forming outer membrane protein [Gammaproteobacteria bacterium]
MKRHAEYIALIPIGAEERVEEKRQEQVKKNNFATVPKLEGGFTASIGALLLVPSSELDSYYFSESGDNVTALNINPSSQFGFDAAVGYIFERTPNGVELSFRDINTSDDASDDDSASTNLDYHLRAVDLMFGQFVDFGQQVQMRFAAGVAYAELKRDQNTNITSAGSNQTTEYSDYKGIGPRIGLDARYDFGQGFGIVGSGSLAYLLGKMKTSFSAVDSETVNVTNNNDDQAVMNLRGNLGIDYVYFFENELRYTLGIELGYLIDYYDDSVRSLNLLPIPHAGTAQYENTSALSFAGPYLNLKGVF